MLFLCDVIKKSFPLPSLLIYYLLYTSVFCFSNLALKYLWNRFLCIVCGRGQVSFSHLHIVPAPFIEKVSALFYCTSVPSFLSVNCPDMFEFILGLYCFIGLFVLPFPNTMLPQLLKYYNTRWYLVEKVLWPCSFSRICLLFLYYCIAK